MKIEVSIVPEPIAEAADWPEELVGKAGARVEFRGLVRDEEDGRAIVALEYEAYSPMAEQVTRAILEDIGKRHPCMFVRVTHRVGLVPVGHAAVRVLAASSHRAAAFAMVTELMDRLKQDVPIWKRRAVRPPPPEVPR